MKNSFPIYFTIAVIIIIISIIAHHAYIHNGEPFELEDMTFTIFGIVKSHEGITLIIVVIAVAVIAGDHFYKRIK